VGTWFSFYAGIGVGLSRDAATIMIGQYFKRRREVVEIAVVSSSGFGILFMSIFFNKAIRYSWTF